MASSILLQLQGLIGIALITLTAWALSEDRRNRPRALWILGAIALQIAIALIVVRVPFVWSIIGLANHAVVSIVNIIGIVIGRRGAAV